MWLQEDVKFNIGDLVKVKEDINFIAYKIDISKGDIGLVVAVDFDHEILSVWGIDYIVLIRGQTLIFFDSELELISPKQEDNTELQD
jgi:hypothetical protein|tara:strand:- start:4120 stop:4380 length:261 start_codon:yes stop_codon:yes gene_type:complete